MTAAPQPPIIVITGPTASGKSSLALALASRYGGEIICADSRTVYRGMDIGTAKPTLDDQRQVRHHLLDVADPDQRFTASDFQRLAREAIDDIVARGNIPFIVGGTGLYVDSVVLDYHFGGAADESKRDLLELRTVDELKKMLKQQRIPLPFNHLNKRHLIRALEQGTVNTERKSKPDDNVYVVAIATEKSELDRRIALRTEEIFSSGVVEEATKLSTISGWTNEAMTGNIYPILRRYIEGSISLDEAKELFAAKDRQLAKRQITWLKRHDFVRWLDLDAAEQYLTEIIETTYRP